MTFEQTGGLLNVDLVRVVVALEKNSSWRFIRTSDLCGSGTKEDTDTVVALDNNDTGNANIGIETEER